MKRESTPTEEAREHREERTAGDSPRPAVEGAEALEARIAELEQENQQLRDKALRSVAEVENIRRRADAERRQTLEYANEQLLKQILPIVDDFERTVESGGQTADIEAYRKGVELVRANLMKTLDRIGVKRMSVVGEPFDVHLHEAIMRQPSEAPEDTVITDVEPGYTYHDRVLRHAKVIISAGG
ncbi:MAG TPA: nucleotide exchange factor GrpE [Candidatus Kapabacteria bacterium]|jgi:molecular chaperone GrpE|nr:nucleotide exchange factor GrpE [Candidatus Kapabacteria bacterium]